MSSSGLRWPCRHVGPALLMVYPPQLPQVILAAVTLLGSIGGLEDHVVNPHISRPLSATKRRPFRPLRPPKADIQLNLEAASWWACGAGLAKVEMR